MRVPVEDLLGWVASLLTLITFAQTSMLPLRVTAILANVFFIAYGALGHFLPILTLHAVLLPLNSARLLACVGESMARQGIADSVARRARSPTFEEEEAFGQCRKEAAASRREESRRGWTIRTSGRAIKASLE